MADVTKFQKQLEKLGACSEARDWVGRRSLTAAWREVDRGDWMLWLAAQAGVDRRLVVLAACDVARTSLRHVPDGENRPRVAIETAEAWARGEATIEQVKAAAHAASASAAAWAAHAASAAAWAAHAASAAAWAAHAASAAASYASDAAHAASYASYAAYAARKRSLKRATGIVRKRISARVIAKALRDKEARGG